MKLYYSPGACSLGPHILLEEIAAQYETEAVDLKTHKTKMGEDFYKINPKGAVPTLILDNGEVLTEAAIILQYIADQKPEANLIAKPGTPDRYRYMELLNFITTELHKGYGPIFGAARLVQNAEGQEELKRNALEGLAKKFDFISKRLESGAFLFGQNFTAPDAYLFTILRWAKAKGPDLSKFPALLSFVERVSTRPAVQKAMVAEGLAKPA